MQAKSPDGRTPGHRQLEVRVDVVVDRSVPEPPATITGRGLEEWEKVWTAGWWLVRDQDYHWVEMIAQAYSDIEEWRKEVKATGLIVEGYNGQMAANPLIKSINQAQQTIMKALSILGFSPTDRAKLMIKQAEAQDALQQMLSARDG